MWDEITNPFPKFNVFIHILLGVWLLMHAWIAVNHHLIEVQLQLPAHHHSVKKWKVYYVSKNTYIICRHHPSTLYHLISINIVRCSCRPYDTMVVKYIQNVIRVHAQLIIQSTPNWRQNMAIILGNVAMYYSISQEICTRLLLGCALLWLYIDWFSHIHQAYFTGTVVI